MSDAVISTPRSRRRQSFRLDRELEHGERRRRVPVSGLPAPILCYFSSLRVQGGLLHRIRSLRWGCSTSEMLRVYVHETSSYLKATEINFSSLAFSHRKVNSKADECLQTIPKVNAGDARGNGVSVVRQSSS